ALVQPEAPPLRVEEDARRRRGGTRPPRKRQSARGGRGDLPGVARPRGKCHGIAHPRGRCRQEPRRGAAIL
ncbi:MAG: hypothetical protein AVDCRST_MAG01-01-3124, partial [uncultured Rubrobacteraceae bacterium]